MRNGGFGMSTTHDVNIAGAGRGRTILKATGTASQVLVLEATAASTLSGLSIVIDSHAGTGLGLVTATAHDIDATIDPATAPSGAIAAEVVSGAVIRDSTLIGEMTSSTGAGVLIGGGATCLLDHDVLEGHYGVHDPGASVKVQRSTLMDSFVDLGVSGTGGDLTADDDLLLMGDGPTDQVFGVRATNDASATLRSATVYSASGKGTAVAADTSTSGLNTSVTVLDSILWNMKALASSASAGHSVITANYLDSNGGVSGGTNADVNTGANMTNGDPLFAGAGDFRLRFGSAAIDSGGDCATTCQTVLDLQGLTRPIDGNGDGVAVRDIGAYEYARRGPSATASADRTSALTGELLAFSGNGSSDPDPGDALTFSWSFDDGSAASGQDVTHAFTTAGSHTATLTVTDPTGLTATTSATVSVAAPPVVPDTTAPVLTKVSVSPSTFLVAKGSTAVSAERHHGTRIKFTLSEAAKVGVSFQRCVLRTYKHHRRCHYMSAGSLTRRSEAKGSDSIAFTGRLGKHRLARGRYRLHLRATDPAGNRSTHKTAAFHIV
jgi:hypothetical protein